MFKTYIVMNFNKHITTRLHSLVSSSKIDYYDLLLKNIPMKSKDVDNLMFLHGERLRNIPPDKIIKTCELFRNLNVVLSPIINIVTCFQQHPSVLKHRIYLLQEMGVPTVDLNMIYRLPIHMKISVNDFKKKTNIPMEQNVMKTMLSHINSEISDPPPLELLDESLPLFLHFEKCILYYSMRELGINNSKSLNRKARKYKSIRLMTRLINMFREEIGVDQEYLRKHVCILDMCPDEARNVLNSLKDTEIGTMTIQEAVKRRPEILQYDPENIKELLKSFKKFELTNDAVNKCLRSLKIKNDVFVKKMTHLLTVPDIKVWCRNPRILYFILNEKMVTERIEYLRKTGYIKWANVHLLTSCRQHFERYKQDELCYTIKRTYVKYILRKELGSDKEYVIDSLTRHPYWNRVSFVDMDCTICFLKKDFLIEDICSNIHLILYPWSLIDETLKIIQESFDNNETSTSSQVLALCLYWLEKNNHFTGDGIWNIKTETRKSSQKKEIILKDDISCRSNETLDILNNNQPHTVDQQHMHKT